MLLEVDCSYLIVAVHAYASTLYIAVHVHDVVTDWSYNNMLSPDLLFPRFLVFPPANPSNFSYCTSIRIPFSTEVLWC